MKRRLYDTHLILWTSSEPHRLSTQARALIADPVHEAYFSAASMWEIAIKKALNRPDFQPDQVALRDGLLAQGFKELPLRSDHALKLNELAPLHKDLFDRILLAQAISEGMTLVTADAVLGKYPGPVLKV